MQTVVQTVATALVALTLIAFVVIGGWLWWGAYRNSKRGKERRGQSDERERIHALELENAALREAKRIKDLEEENRRLREQLGKDEANT